MAGAAIRLDPVVQGPAASRSWCRGGRRTRRRPARQPSCEGERRALDHSRAWPARVPALAIYASRWPLERTLPSVDPRLARVSESIGCGAPPDLTRRALPIIRVAHVCGTTLRLRNELATAADITWDVDGTEEAGHLVLP